MPEQVTHVPETPLDEEEEVNTSYPEAQQQDAGWPVIDLSNISSGDVGTVIVSQNELPIYPVNDGVYGGSEFATTRPQYLKRKLCEMERTANCLRDRIDTLVEDVEQLRQTFKRRKLSVKEQSAIDFLSDNTRDAMFPARNLAFGIREAKMMACSNNRPEIDAVVDLRLITCCLHRRGCLAPLLGLSKSHRCPITKEYYMSIQDDVDAAIKF